MDIHNINTINSTIINKKIKNISISFFYIINCNILLLILSLNRYIFHHEVKTFTSIVMQTKIFFETVKLIAVILVLSNAHVGLSQKTK